MRDAMNPIVQFSAFGGKLIEEPVAGSTSGQINPENNVDVSIGFDRSMFAYVPASGCPHPKQCQVLMVLRDDADRESAEMLLEDLGLAALAEERHFVLLFPNPEEGGWNYAQDPARDDDRDFLVRCFAALPRSRGGVAGFNGMIFHLATSPASSAMLATLALTRPLDAAAIMVGSLPQNYVLPAGMAQQAAWLYEESPLLASHLALVNGGELTGEVAHGVESYRSADNPSLVHFLGTRGLDRRELVDAWELMFSETRRWRNTTMGTYQARTPFDERGFVAHVHERPLPDDVPRTWFEYVPPQVRATQEQVPLVIYLHGGNCCGLYGAEQSGWHDLADRDGFACVYPDATIEDRWNVWDDPRIPSDMDFVLWLIDHMNEVHPIDRSRVYVSGFSMGSMMTNALACAYPETFAGAVALNGPHWGYLETLDESIPGVLALSRTSVVSTIEPLLDTVSPTRARADAKKAERDWRMPLVQFVGLKDNALFPPGRVWPLQEDDLLWAQTIRYWKTYNGIACEPLLAPTAESGIASDVMRVEGDDERFVWQSWMGGDGAEGLYHVVGARELYHAVDLREIELGWAYVRQFARTSDGSLCRSDSALTWA